MMKRKIVLLTALAALSAAWGLQLFLSRGDSVRIVKLSDKPDSILIEKADGTSILAVKDGGNWVLTDAKYPADAAEAENLSAALESIKVLDTVSRGGDDERYGFEGSAAVAVTAKKGGTVVRQLRIGKAAMTGQQSYAKLDGGAETLLVSGNLGRVFGKNLDQLRDKRIAAFKQEEAVAVSVAGEQPFRLSRAGERNEWTVVAPRESAGTKLDQQALSAWIGALGSLKAERFAEEGPAPGARPLGEIAVDLGTRTATVALYGKSADGSYLCLSSESPYPFLLSQAGIGLYQRRLEDLAAK